MTDEEQTAYHQFRSTIDPTSFSNLPYVRRIEKPWGWEIHFVPESLPYMGKLIHINAGKRVSLQAHDGKQESWLKLSGDARLILENPTGSLDEIAMEDGKGYSLALGQVHRLIAGETDAEFLEVSTPEKGTTFHIEDDYNRPSETEELRAKRNRDGKN